MSDLDHAPNRRRLIQGGGALVAAAALPTPTFAQTRAADHAIRIAPLAHEIAPGKVVSTTAYNGLVPGPTLRLREGKPVTIDVVNASGYANIVHWHGLFLPSVEDGAAEEGSPIIPDGETRLYAFAPEPAGTRWYHSHAMAMSDLTKSTYSGEYGFLIVEPASDPARYDREVLLAAHHWDGEWVSLQDFKKGPPKDNGLESMYRAATLGERMLGHGEPVRVRQGERVLFRLLNASGNMGISLALPGHRFTVVALDGNLVPTRASVDVLQLDVAERADVIVEMDNPGVWVLGAVDSEDREMGMGVVVEYAGASGPARWIQPAKTPWDYTIFGHGTGRSAAAAPQTIALEFKKVPGGRGNYNRWTINGKSWPDTNPLFTVEQGKRYRLIMNNNNGDEHPVHLHRHSFEIVKVGDKTTSGVFKDTIHMPRYSTAEIEFVAQNPGATLFHCHHQIHMDEGFAGLIVYA